MLQLETVKIKETTYFETPFFYVIFSLLKTIQSRRNLGPLLQIKKTDVFNTDHRFLNLGLKLLSTCTRVLCLCFGYITQITAT